MNATTTLENRIADKLQFLYGEPARAQLLARIRHLIDAHPIAPRTAALSESDVLLIAYGDHVQSPGEMPLRTLHRFASERLRDLISGVHILPFYPYTSDDGFSVVDYLQVDPALGDWDDVQRLGGDFRLMADLVLNHISASSAWFQGFLKGDPRYRDYFVTVDPSLDLSAVVRPRTHPVLTPFETAEGVRHVWTTFSEDQIDLNFANPDVLIEVLKSLLVYVQRGADFIRLDAVAFLWKIPGTSCIHLPQTHAVVQLMRDVLDLCAPWVILITETNVPHAENLSYFGDGHNEAQMVYQFALPPLLLHTLYTGDARDLTAWAATLETPSDATTFFNFSASHDGIGVRPVTGLLSADALQALVDGVQARGGRISYRTNTDGTQSPYELNITYFDALATPGEPLADSVARYLVSQSIQMALAGVPGVYLPSLFGSPNWQAGVAQTGRARTINREKFDLATLSALLDDPHSRQGQVFRRYSHLLKLRRSLAVFHPSSPQVIHDLSPAVFAVERGGDLLALHNVTDQPLTLDLPAGYGRDLIAGEAHAGRITLRPYQVAWLAR